MVVGGSLTKGIDVRLEGGVPIEEVSVGRFVTIQAERRRFFGVVTDISLGQTDPAMVLTPPDVDDDFIRAVVSGANAFGLVHVVPYLTQTGAAGLDDGPLPAKTVPPHFAPARYSAPQEIEAIFGENDKDHLWVGSPLDMEEAPICLDADRLTERSTGVFGKTGTGKSFLTRVLLAEIVMKGHAVSLVFDMHSEYGWASPSESGGQVKGLKQLFPGRVGVFTLDDASTRRKGASADYVVRIGYDDIEAADVASAAGVLGLNETQVQAIERLEKRHGRKWLRALLDADGVDELTELAGGVEHEGTLAAVHRRVQRLGALDFLTAERPEDSVRRIMEYLEAGKHVVLEFGRHRNNLGAYILVANLLTRRIHEKYVDRVEASLAGSGKPPPNLVIAVEEAHKFLSPGVAGYTSFGTIARELAQVQRHATHHRSTPQRHRPRGAVADRHQVDVSLGGRPRHRRGARRRLGARRVARRSRQAGDEAAGAYLRPRRPHAGGRSHTHLRPRLLQERRLPRTGGAPGCTRPRRRRSVRRAVGLPTPSP